jgi:hypothetical protein
MPHLVSDAHAEHTRTHASVPDAYAQGTHQFLMRMLSQGTHQFLRRMLSMF